MDRRIAQVVLAVGRQLEGSIQLLGTGFALGGSKLATTAHVTGPSDKDLCVVLPKIKTLDDYQDTTDNNVQTHPARIAAYDPVRDIAILELQGAEFTTGYKIGASDMASMGAPVVSLGYPHADHGRLVLTQQQSAVGARVVLGKNGIKTKHLILNVQARPGQSGSPVFTIDGTSVVAMIIGSYAPGGGGGISLGGIDPHTLHQTTHAISAEYLPGLLG